MEVKTKQSNSASRSPRGRRPIATGAVLLAALALALPLGATAAQAADPGCNGLGLAAGIYGGYLDAGYFDMGFNPTSGNVAAAIATRAILCGASDTDDSFYKTLKFSFPSQGERFVCARPSPSVWQCDSDGNGVISANENTQDGSYAGAGTLDYWCGSDLCTDSGLNVGDNAPVQIHVDRTANPHCKVTSALVACYQIDMEGAPYLLPELLPETCPADLIVSRQRRPANSPYTATIHQPDCGDDSVTILDEDGDVVSHTDHLWAPVYLLTIDDLTFCRYVGASGSTDCADFPTGRLGGGNAVFVNGDSGSYKITLESKLTTGEGPWASKTGSWS